LAPIVWFSLYKYLADQSMMVRDPINLIGKEVYVRKNSAHYARLSNLSEEIGGDIKIIEDFEDVRQEELIQKVADGEIDYTIADENVGLVNATYFPNLDVKTPVSFSQKIAWAVRKNAPELQLAINKWLAYMKKRPEFNLIYKKYFEDHKGSLERLKSGQLLVKGGTISDYDDLIKRAADSVGCDWRLVASQMFQESRFDPRARSWAGARGLMQLMPATARSFGAKNSYDPEQNVMAASRYIKWLDNLWSSKILHETERVKFILASYNVGQGHVEDARNLAKKYGYDPNIWNQNVAVFILRKSNPKYFKDPVVKFGYCRGNEPVKYVKNIQSRYEEYQGFIDQ